MLWYHYVILFFVLILLLLFGAGYFFFVFACKRRSPLTGEEAIRMSGVDYKKYLEDFKEGHEWLMNHPHDMWQIVSRDGLKLVGHFYDQGAKKTVIMVHGYRSSGLTDFASIAPVYYENGCNLLIIDQRACGQSQGNYITFGVKERYDLVDWVNYYNSRTKNKHRIYLDGVSMGATTVLLGSGLLEATNIRGVIADCGFTSPYDIFKAVGKNYFGLPTFPLVPIVGVYTRLFAKFSIKEASTLEAIKTKNFPYIFVHGKKDKFVPSWMSEQNYRAAQGKKQIILVDEAGHGESYLYKKEELDLALAKFIQ